MINDEVKARGVTRICRGIIEAEVGGKLICGTQQTAIRILEKPLTEFRTTARKYAGNLQQTKYYEYKEMNVFKTGKYVNSRRVRERTNKKKN
jgi:hypothetical protein